LPPVRSGAERAPDEAIQPQARTTHVEENQMSTQKNVPRIKTLSGAEFQLNARPDTVDFRDRMYVPTLVKVPTERQLAEWQVAKVPIRDQGAEGACTGFGLAAVADYLLRTRREPADGVPEVSPHMLYAMARRYDEWPGEDYSGSSARGAMKGWYQHGVCSQNAWPQSAGVLDQPRSKDALARPLGAYYRVDHSDLIAMHAALAEVGVLYATAQVHAGWRNPDGNGVIKFEEQILGGHAFAIVGFDSEGFWVQNSWGPGWGKGGFGRVAYSDWLHNGTDVWVARLGVPLSLEATVGATSTATFSIARATPEVETTELRPHIVSLGNNGRLQQTGPFGNSLSDIQQILQADFARITAGWSKPRLMLFAHGGLNDEATAVERTKQYRDLFLPRQIYPLCIVWHTDLISTMSNLLADGLQQRRPEGFLDASRDFLLDRMDDTLEPFARAGGLLTWDKIKQNAESASLDPAGGLRQMIPLLPANAELHLVGHSAGGNLQAAFASALASENRAIDSCTLWAPGNTMKNFEASLMPLVGTQAIKRFALYTLSDKAEQDDTCGFYNKSILYLVSNALEATPHIPWMSDGEPLLGMARFVARQQDFFNNGNAEWVVAPNNASGTRDASQTKHHANFDNDPDTLESTIARILNVQAALPASVKSPLPTRKKAERRRELINKMDWAEAK
jgi:hypothetical protein